MEADDAFRAEIGKLTSRADNAARDFGGLVQSDVKPLAEGLKQIKGFSGDSAVDAVATFREKASDLYLTNPSLAKAYRKAAEAIEDRIDRALPDGSDVLKNYRAARTTMAQTFDVEKALREGQGVVDAKVIGKLFEKNPDRMSGDIAKIGRVASAMPDVMGVPKAGWANTFTALDSSVGTLGSIFAGNPAPLAIPGARAIGRKALMSDQGQKMFAMPKYGPTAIDGAPATLLKALEQRAAGATVGSTYPFEE
jgi:hypothetical protein